MDWNEVKENLEFASAVVALIEASYKITQIVKKRRKRSNKGKQKSSEIPKQRRKRRK